jgi:hypothetical protein
MYGDLPCEIAYNLEYQESSSQEEEDGTEASDDEEEIKAAKWCSQDDFWLKTPPFIASELLFFAYFLRPCGAYLFISNVLFPLDDQEPMK